jgi:hypothetical protein
MMNWAMTVCPFAAGGSSVFLASSTRTATTETYAARGRGRFSPGSCWPTVRSPGGNSAANCSPDANDPLASLRWCLAELRRALGDASILTGDPVRQELPDHFAVDALTLDRDIPPDIGTGALLEGIDTAWSPQFDLWLLVAREHVAGIVASRLHQRVVTALMRGRAEDAVRWAELAARRSPLDERAHPPHAPCL